MTIIVSSICIAYVHNVDKDEGNGGFLVSDDVLWMFGNWECTINVMDMLIAFYSNPMIPD